MAFEETMKVDYPKNGFPNETNNGVDDEFLDYSLVVDNCSRFSNWFCKSKCFNLELKKRGIKYTSMISKLVELLHL
ncbi:hypothetical protein V1477_006802 [Vespula maculifrons]|uniref:Uncharacterized protein n=1 Tax=Vespula maculifrons TaxID=7453 RepID=A0ABD2CGQ9_VESMC